MQLSFSMYVLCNCTIYFSLYLVYKWNNYLAEFICFCCLKSKWKRNANNLEIAVSNANPSRTTSTKSKEDVTDSQQIQSEDVGSPEERVEMCHQLVTME